MIKAKYILFILICMKSFGQEMPVKNDYQKLAEIFGDLDNDRVDEKVIVFEVRDSLTDNIIREIQILKKNNGSWTIWRKSQNAILKKGDNGVMGEPFDGVEVKNGVLMLIFSGGNNWHWAHTDKYRFQDNEFQLIGHTNSYGKPCEYWSTFDFNISTGKINYKREYEACEEGGGIYKKENETFYHKQFKANLGNRNLKHVKIITPKYKHDVFL